MPARQCSLSRESSVVLCLVRKKEADVDACFEYAFSSGEPVLAGDGRDAVVDSSGSFSFPMLLLSTITELGPSTIGAGTNNIGTNAACLGSFPVSNHVTSVAADERKAVFGSPLDC